MKLNELRGIVHAKEIAINDKVSNKVHFFRGDDSGVDAICEVYGDRDVKYINSFDYILSITIV